MFITARASLPAKPLARSLDAALAFAAQDGPLTGAHLKLTARGLAVLGSDGTGVCASLVESKEVTGLVGRWLTLTLPDAEDVIDWIRANGHDRLSLKVGAPQISLVPPAGASLQRDITMGDAAENGTDVRDDLLRSLTAIAHDWAPMPQMPAELLHRLAEIQHLGSPAAPAVQLVPTANGWAGSFDDGAAVFAYAARRTPCDAQAVLAHVSATGAELAAAGRTLLEITEADVAHILERNARR